MSEPVRELKTIDDLIEAFVDISEVVNSLSDGVADLTESHNLSLEDIRSISSTTSKLEQNAQKFEDKDRVEFDLKNAQARKAKAEAAKIEAEMDDDANATKLFKRGLGIALFVSITLFGLGVLVESVKD